MGNTNSRAKITAQDRAILDLKNQRDKLRQYQKRISVLTSRETEIARACLARGDKAKALLALRRKKYQESLISKTDAQLEQLEKLTSSVEFALVQKDVYFGLQRGTEVLREINAEMGGLQAVEKLMDDTAEARAEQERIGAALAGGLTNDEEDEVEDELDALQREVVVVPPLPDVPLRTVVAEGSLPDVPTTEVTAAAVETEEDRERRRKARARERRVAAMELAPA
ncbi:hypothetical protein DV735_g5826, partial [Chaetothyriales sp. CBS 134920]